MRFDDLLIATFSIQRKTATPAVPRLEFEGPDVKLFRIPRHSMYSVHTRNNNNNLKLRK